MTPAQTPRLLAPTRRTRKVSLLIHSKPGSLSSATCTHPLDSSSHSNGPRALKTPTSSAARAFSWENTMGDTENPYIILDSLRESLTNSFQQRARLTLLQAVIELQVPMINAGSTTITQWGRVPQVPIISSSQRSIIIFGSSYSREMRHFARKDIRHPLPLEGQSRFDTQAGRRPEQVLK